MFKIRTFDNRRLFHLVRQTERSVFGHLLYLTFDFLTSLSLVIKVEALKINCLLGIFHQLPGKTCLPFFHQPYFGTECLGRLCHLRQMD